MIRYAKKWKFAEEELNCSSSFGSGYPADPLTKTWLRKNIDSLFGFPALVRFSWSTASSLMDMQTSKVEWPDEEEESSEENSVTSYFVSAGTADQRPEFFRCRNMRSVARVV